MAARNFLTNPIKENESYYEVLGISPDADLAAIKKAYRELSKINHPDKHNLEAESDYKKAEEETAKLNAIYKCLSNPQERAYYNTKQTMKGFNAQSTAQPTHDPLNKGSYPKEFQFFENTFKAETLFQKEHWIGFESFARKVLSCINPLKKFIFLGSSTNIPYLNYKATKIQVGSSLSKYKASALSSQEGEDFINFVLLFQHHRKKSGFTGDKSLNIYYSKISKVLEYKVEQVIEIAKLAEGQDKELVDLLKNYAEFLNHKTYLQQKIKDYSSEVEVNFYFDSKKGKLNFRFYKSKELLQELWSKFKVEFKEWYPNIQLEEENKIASPKFTVSYDELLPYLNQIPQEVTQIADIKAKEKWLEHLIDSLKLHLECRDYEESDKLIEKIKNQGISFAEIEKLTAKNKVASPLMTAVQERAPLAVIEKLVDLGSSLDYKQEGCRPSIFEQAVSFEEPQVLVYLCNKIGILDEKHEDFRNQQKVLENIEAFKNAHPSQNCGDIIRLNFYKSLQDYSKKSKQLDKDKIDSSSSSKKASLLNPDLSTTPTQTTHKKDVESPVSAKPNAQSKELKEKRSNNSFLLKCLLGLSTLGGIASLVAGIMLAQPILIGVGVTAIVGGLIGLVGMFAVKPKPEEDKFIPSNQPAI